MFRNCIAGIIAILWFCSTINGQQAVIEGRTEALVGSSVVLDASKSTGDGHQWIYPKFEDFDYLVVDNGARIFFASPKPRKITFTLIIYKIQDATSLSDSPFTEGRGISTSIVEHTVNIGSVDDNPDPDPDPVDPVDPPDQDEPDFSGIAKVIENSAAVKADPTTKNSLARAYLEAHNGITDSTTLQQAIEFKQLKIRTVLRGRPNASVDWTNFQVELDNVFRAADFNKDLSLYKAALLEVSKQLSK